MFGNQTLETNIWCFLTQQVEALQHEAETLRLCGRQQQPGRRHALQCHRRERLALRFWNVKDGQGIATGCCPQCFFCNK